MSQNDAEYYFGIGNYIVPGGIFERFPELRLAVGNSYYREDGKHKKLMIVGESNYFPESLESESVFQDAEKWYKWNDVGLIPESMLKPLNYVSNWKEGSRTFDKVYKIIGEVLAKHNIECKEELGHEITFYNYFLRPAFNPGKGSYKKIKPQKNDYEVAGVALKEIISKLEPEVIVFVSTKAYDAFVKFLKNITPKLCRIHKVSHPSSVWWNRNGGIYGREKFRDVLEKYYIV